MRPFVSRVPAPGGGAIDACVVPLTYDDASFWHQEFQPDIDRIADRLDRGWNWAQAPFWLALVEALNRRTLIGYAITLQAGARAVPAGFVLLSAGYPALEDAAQASVYVWYLAAAPTHSLRRMGVAVKPPLLEALIDIGMVESEARGYDGRIGLHAASRANSPSAIRLHAAYRHRCGLRPLPSHVRLPGVRRNDGRYFIAPPAVAQARMAGLDACR